MPYTTLLLSFHLIYSIYRDLLARGPVKDQSAKEGFIKVKKKRFVGNSVVPREPDLTTCSVLLSNGADICTCPGYILRDEEFVEIIRNKPNFTLRVERLESRHNANFKSFMARLLTEYLWTFMEFLPRERRCQGRLPNTARHTAPTLRVN